MKDTQPVRVWDLFVRLFHWSLVACFFVAYFSTESIDWVHKGFGYATLALVFARAIWGFIGSRHARFSDFVPGPRGLWNYTLALLRGKEPRHIGHNPAGSVMILFLLCAVTGIGVTGWMMTLDAFWGNGTVETTHIVLVDMTLIAVAIHVCANIYGSLRHRENLILSMITGYKRGPLAPHPVAEDRPSPALDFPIPEPRFVERRRQGDRRRNPSLASGFDGKAGLGPG
jgi:cytochrome b